LSAEPWFGPVPFLTFHRLLAQPGAKPQSQTPPPAKATKAPGKSDWIAADCWGALDWEASDAHPLGPLLDPHTPRAAKSAALPTPPQTLRPDPLASILARAAMPSRSQDASGLGKTGLGKTGLGALPAGPLRASNANGLPQARRMPPRRAAHGRRRIGQR
ncbi:MAG: hypothetical protein ACPGFC_05880, partial [Paracoccaceae bacterium]